MQDRDDTKISREGFELYIAGFFVRSFFIEGALLREMEIQNTSALVPVGNDGVFGISFKFRRGNEIVHCARLSNSTARDLLVVADAFKRIIIILYLDQIPLTGTIAMVFCIWMYFVVVRHSLFCRSYGLLSPVVGCISTRRTQLPAIWKNHHDIDSSVMSSLNVLT